MVSNEIKLLVLRAARAVALLTCFTLSFSQLSFVGQAIAESNHGETRKTQKAKPSKPLSLNHPIVTAYRDCIVEYARQNASADINDIDMELSAQKTSCATQFDTILQLVFASYNSQALRNKQYRRIAQSVRSAVKEARSSEINRQAQAQKRTDRTLDNQTPLVVDCIGNAALTAARSTSESAEAIATASIAQCYSVIRASAEAIGDDYRSRYSSGTEEQRQTIVQKVVESFTQQGRETAIAVVVKVRSSRAESHEQPTGQSSGSGIAISAGIVLTNAHVVKDCKVLSVRSSGVETSARPLAVDSKRDLAIIGFAGNTSAVAKLRTQAAPQIGEAVYVFGYPLTGALSSNGNFTTGLVSALEGIRNDPQYLQISAPVQPGNSGGPLLDSHGNLIGVVTAKLDALVIAGQTGDIPQNVNFAIRLDHVAEFLRSNNVAFAEAKAHESELPVTGIASLAQSFSVQVLCTP